MNRLGLNLAVSLCVLSLVCPSVVDTTPPPTTAAAAAAAATKIAATTAAAATAAAAAKTAALPSCPIPALPSKFFMQERFFVTTHESVVEIIGEDRDAAERKWGTIDSEIMNLHSRRTWHYAVDDPAAVGRYIAQSHQNILTTITEIFIRDCNDNALGSIRELYHRKGSAVSVFEILTPTGDIVAKSQLTSNFGIEIDIQDPDGKRVAKMTRPWIQLRDRWTIKVGSSKHPLATDPRVLVLLMANHTASGYWGFGPVVVISVWICFMCCCCGCPCCCSAIFNRAHQRQSRKVSDRRPSDPPSPWASVRGTWSANHPGYERIMSSEGGESYPGSPNPPMSVPDLPDHHVQTLQTRGDDTVAQHGSIAYGTMTTATENHNSSTTDEM